MYPKSIQNLINNFQKLPGIGPKQAAKFAFRVLGMDQTELDLFSHDLKEIKKKTSVCKNCLIVYERDRDNLCPICRDEKRNQKYICVVETQRDAYSIENSRIFEGVYHVLGERVSLKGGEMSSLAIKPLEERLRKMDKAEVILAMSATTGGQSAALYLERALRPLNKKITRLGRGLSSGIEIEYADKDTLVDAFQNRR